MLSTEKYFLTNFIFKKQKNLFNQRKCFQTRGTQMSISQISCCKFLARVLPLAMACLLINRENVLTELYRTKMKPRFDYLSSFSINKQQQTTNFCKKFLKILGGKNVGLRSPLNISQYFKTELSCLP